MIACGKSFTAFLTMGSDLKSHIWTTGAIKSEIPWTRYYKSAVPIPNVENIKFVTCSGGTDDVIYSLTYDDKIIRSTFDNNVIDSHEIYEIPGIRSLGSNRQGYVVLNSMGNILYHFGIGYKLTEMQPISNSQIISVSIADDHILLLDQTGSVYYDNKLDTALAPTFIDNLPQIVEIASSIKLPLVRDVNNNIWIINPPNASSTQLVATNIVKIVGGPSSHSAALFTINNQPYLIGQLASLVNNDLAKISPGNIRDIALGPTFGFVIFYDGTVNAFGSNHNGELGLGSSSKSIIYSLLNTKVPGMRITEVNDRARFHSKNAYNRQHVV